MMTETGTVLSGSAALEIVAPGSCEPRDLNFYCPVGTASQVISSLLENEGFAEVPTSLQAILAERTPFSKFEVNNGIKRLTKMVHQSSSRTVTVAESISASPVAPILFFHSTLLMNCVTGTGVMSLYPDLTYEHTGEWV
ncbi:hypothetical protein DFP72DRAFT_769247, partial [Ephemerocybe angulata]